MANTLTRYLRRLYQTAFVTRSLEAGGDLINLSGLEPAPHTELLDMLLAYYYGNSVYDVIAPEATGSIPKALRNPIAAFCGFYEDHLWPNSHEIEVDEGASEAISDVLDDARTRSNWLQQRGEVAVTFPLYGEMAIKTEQKSDGTPYHKVLDMREVTEIEVDERGFTSWCRIDKPAYTRDEESGDKITYWYTEVWVPGRQRIWRYERRPSDWQDLNKLPRNEGPFGDLPGYEERVFRAGERPFTPAESVILPDGYRQFNNSRLTIDFIPIAYARFRPDSGDRGLPGPLIALEDIDEASALATAMHRQLRAHRPDKQLVSVATDSEGKPIPQAHIGDLNSEDVREVELATGEVVYEVPAGWTLQTLIAQLDFAAMLDITAAQMLQVRDKLPELEYYRVSQEAGENASGRAIYYRLRPALARAERARSYAEACLALADKHLLTIGQRAGLEGYEEASIGTFEAGSFDHKFKEQPMLRLSREEKAAIAVQLSNFGTPGGAMQVAGFSEQEAEKVTLGEAGASTPRAGAAQTPERLSRAESRAAQLLEEANGNTA